MAVKTAFILIGLALMFGGFTAMVLNMDSEQQTALVNSFREDPAEATSNTALFAISYDFLTPSWHTPQWFGSDDTRTFILEDIPYPSGWDAFYLVPLVFIFWLILKLSLWKSNIHFLWKALITLFVMTVVIFGSYIIARILFLKVLDTTATELGISAAAEQGRLDYSASLKEKGQAAFWALALAFYSLYAYADMMITKAKS